MKKGWQTKKLSEVSDVFDGPHATPKTVDSGPIFLGIGALQDGVINLGETRHVTEEDFKQWTRRVRPQPDDVVFSYETRLGQAAIIPEGLECCLGRRMGLVRFKGGTVDPRFFLLQYLSPQFREFLDSKTIRGATVDRISIKDFPSFPISVPPLAEQQRIVGLLDEAFEGLATAKANAEKNLQNARALFESHLQSVFTQRGPGWVEKTLGEIGKVSMCKRIFKEETKATGDIPFYKIGTFGKEPDAFIPNQTYNEYRAKYSFPQKGAVLISAAGTIGRRVRYDGEPAYFQDSNIVWIDNDEKQVLNDYLYHFYGACDWNSTKGATIPRLYNDNLRRISIGFPKSLQEQLRIVAQLDALSEETQRLARLYERKHAALEALKKSLLHQAFTGEL